MVRLHAGRYPPKVSLWPCPLRYQHPSPALLDGDPIVRLHAPSGPPLLKRSRARMLLPVLKWTGACRDPFLSFFFRPISTVPVPCHAMRRTLEKLIVTELPKTGLDWTSQTIWPPT